jgi:hypothetical protein
MSAGFNENIYFEKMRSKEEFENGKLLLTYVLTYVLTYLLTYST